MADGCRDENLKRISGFCRLGLKIEEGKPE
jgi:hypothetical protein